MRSENNLKLDSGALFFLAHDNLKGWLSEDGSRAEADPSWFDDGQLPR